MKSILDKLAARAVVGEMGVMTPRAIQLFQGRLGAWFKFWSRPRLLGLENLPADGAFLVVANHSGGGIHEVGVLVKGWLDATGGQRKIVGLMHPMMFQLPIIKGVVKEFGVLPSSYANGLTALQSGLPAVIFPGGDHECFRPLWQIDTVDFNQRKGFLRLAKEAGVPIVPLGISGTHINVPILWRSDFLLPWGLVLPRLYGMKRVPLTLTGFVGAAAFILAGIYTSLGLWGGLLAWAWLTLSPHPAVPLIRSTAIFNFGKPISHAELFADGGSLEQAYEQVIADVRSLVKNGSR